MKMLLLVLISISSFGFGEYMTPLQKLAFQIEYKARLTGNIKSKPGQPRSCVEEFEKMKNRYNESLCSGGSRLMEVGIISGKVFTHEEIQNMPKSHPHLRSTIRGTNKYVNFAVYGSAPSYPHTFKECENFFSEKVEIINLDGKLCRQVTFTAPELGGESYTQMYCEDKATLFLSVN